MTPVVRHGGPFAWAAYLSAGDGRDRFVGYRYTRWGAWRLARKALAEQVDTEGAPTREGAARPCAAARGRSTRRMSSTTGPTSHATAPE